MINTERQAPFIKFKTVKENPRVALMMDSVDIQQPPLKKLKSHHISMDGAMDDMANTHATVKANVGNNQDVAHDQFCKELVCGITEFVSPELPGFTGILKKRYTDFLVNEILPSGVVVHLDNLKAPHRGKQQVDKSSDAKFAHSASVGQAPIERSSNIMPVQSNNEFNDQNQLPALSQPAIQKAQPAQSAAEDRLQHDKTLGADQDTQPSVPSIPALAQASGPRVKERFFMQPTSDGWSVVKEKDRPVQSQKTSEQASNPSTNINADGGGSQSSPQLKAEHVGDVNDTSKTQISSGPPAQPSTPAAWQAYASKDVPKEFELSTEDRDLLISYFDEQIVELILILYKNLVRKPHLKVKEYGAVKSAIITDRETRTKIHQAIRRIFNSRLESVTDDTGAMTISAAAPPSQWSARAPNSRDGVERKPQQKGKPGWQELGGDYLHFTVYKENKDTMEVIAYLAKQLKMKPQAFQFAGTKDRRGITVQRVSVYRVFADRVIAAGKTLRNAKLGNYEYLPQGLQLGDLTGNEFVITLRDCKFDVQDETESNVQKAWKIVGTAIENLKERGFINYYGLQRFGTFSTRTDTVGVKMLRGDFKAAVEAILDYSPTALAAAQDPTSSHDKVSNDDRARAYALHLFKETANIHPAVDELPRKFTAEASLIRYLGNPQRSNDYYGALQTISRNLRLIYVHAYQSLVWNVASSERWKRYGSKVTVGDLVLVDEHKEKLEKSLQHESIDADGEEIVYPADDDRAGNAEDIFVRARALSAEEANSGSYSIFDVVLPMPGFDVIYPENEMSEFYKEFMGSERGGGLDPFDMRRKWRDVSLSGGYRKLLGRVAGDITYEIRTYEDENQQFIQTDLDRLSQGKPYQDQRAQKSDQANSSSPAQEPIENGGETKVEGSKIAIVLKMQLGASQYATMALRELMKLGGVKTYKPDFGGGR